RVAAHLFAWPQPVAHFRSLRLAEQFAEVVVRKLNAAHARRFAFRHTGNGRGNRQGDAARAAPGSAIHKHLEPGDRERALYMPGFVKTRAPVIRAAYSFLPVRGV